MIKIGLTGNIGSGKSLVSRIFQSLEIPVFNADAEAGELFHHHDVIQRILGEVDGSVLTGNQIDKRKLAGIVFSDRSKLLKLNSIIHPLTFELFDRFANRQNAPYVLMESAVIAEYGLTAYFEAIIGVLAPERIRLQRVMKRDAISEDLVRERMKNQVDEEQIIKISSYLINNNGEQMLIPQVMKIHNKLLQGFLS